MEKCAHHTFLILTKRAGRMAEFFAYMDNLFDRPFRMPNNVMLGVTVEDQKAANERIPILLDLNCRRFISYEPALGPIDLNNCAGVDALNGLVGIPGIGSRLDWVICGGESGSQTMRPMHPDWARLVAEDCEEAGVPFFFKQWGSFMPDGKGDYWVYIDGRIADRRKVLDPGNLLSPMSMSRVSKKISGNLLEGKQWLNFPNLNNG